MKILAMIPARMGSRRLRQKNLQQIGGRSLLEHAVDRSREAGVFDDIWVNSEHPVFEKMAIEAGVKFHRRPEELAGDEATSEQFIQEFLSAHPCDFVVQVHTIAPLLSPEIIADFVRVLGEGQHDALLSVINEQIECLFEGKPVNFSFEKKTNSQELVPVQRITWSISGWRRRTFLQAFNAGGCATYSGRVGFFVLDRLSGHIIKTREDLEIAEMFFQQLKGSVK
jgi:CMP-N-acetylneuraminic acid synthetase